MRYNRYLGNGAQASGCRPRRNKHKLTVTTGCYFQARSVLQLADGEVDAYGLTGISSYHSLSYTVLVCSRRRLPLGHNHARFPIGQVDPQLRDGQAPTYLLLYVGT